MTKLLSPGYTRGNRGTKEMTGTGRSLPALQSIHELSGSVDTFAHQRGLLAHRYQGILEQACLVLRRCRVGHHGGRPLLSLLLLEKEPNQNYLLPEAKLRGAASGLEIGYLRRAAERASSDDDDDASNSVGGALLFGWDARRAVIAAGARRYSYVRRQATQGGQKVGRSTGYVGTSRAPPYGVEHRHLIASRNFLILTVRTPLNRNSYTTQEN